MPQATLHLLCGKVAAGKSTLAAELSRSPLTILIKEDQWLSELFGSEIRTFEDYILYSRRIRRVVGPHVQDLLKLGVSVVLDFPANTVVTRSWMKSLLDGTQADHLIHFIDTEEHICKQRLQARNATGSHEFKTSDAEFDVITSYFEPPSEAEGFRIQRR